MIGLLWLKLLNKDIDSITQNSLSLEEMYPQVQEFKETIQHVNNSQLIEMLLDLEANPNLLLDNVILEFDQWIIIVIKKQEELVSSDVSNRQHGGASKDVNRGTGAFEEMNRRTEEEDVHVREGEEHGQQSEIIKKNLNNNLTRSKAGKTAPNNRTQRQKKRLRGPADGNRERHSQRIQIHHKSTQRKHFSGRGRIVFIGWSTQRNN